MKKILVVLLMLLTVVGCAKEDPPIINVTSEGAVTYEVKCDECGKELLEDEANIIMKDMGSWTAKYHFCDDCFYFIYGDELDGGIPRGGNNNKDKAVTPGGVPELDEPDTTTSSAAYNSFSHSDPDNMNYSFLIGRTYYMVRQGEYIKGTITAKGAYKFDRYSYYEAYYVELDHALGSGWFYFDGDIKFANRIDESDVINITYTDDEELDTLDPTKPLDVKSTGEDIEVNIKTLQGDTDEHEIDLTDIVKAQLGN